VGEWGLVFGGDGKRLALGVWAGGLVANTKQAAGLRSLGLLSSTLPNSFISRKFCRVNQPRPQFHFKFSKLPKSSKQSKKSKIC
jgi:hypothetical protein